MDGPKVISIRECVDYPVDPKLQEAGYATTKAFVGAVHPLVEHYMASQFDNRQQMLDYIDKVNADMENPDYHFYVTMYSALFVIYCTDPHRTAVVGRKPDVGEVSK